MKNLLLPTLCTLLLLACQSNTPVPYAGDDSDSESSDLTEMDTMPSSLLRHVVLFKFKEDASEAQIDEVVQAFAALPSKISEIHSYEAGVNNSPEGLNHGYEHCFIVSFLSEEDRAVYLDHPDHLAFVDILLPILEEPTVIDFWAHK